MLFLADTLTSELGCSITVLPATNMWKSFERAYKKVRVNKTSGRAAAECSFEGQELAVLLSFYSWSRMRVHSSANT